MLNRNHMLKSNTFRAGDIHIHEDLLSTMPSALSRKREQKPNAAPQKDKEDPCGYHGCILCNPELKRQKNPGGAEPEEVIQDRVSTFINDFPYLPYEHRLYFLWASDELVRQHACHKSRLQDMGQAELYWLLLACQQRAAAFKPPSDSADRLRLVAGFNIGDLAGQSVPHLHLQSGWEIALNPRTFSQAELDLYFQELREEDLVIFSHSVQSASSGKDEERYLLVAPWTPAGKYAVDLYFRGKNELTDLDDNDLKTFAVVGNAILRIYQCLGIKNVNIVMRGSVQGCKTEPLQMRFVPRVNTPAMYEILGVNVVDTFPQSIATEFRKAHTDSNGKPIIPPWEVLFKKDVREFDADAVFTCRVPHRDAPRD